jgi:glycosyltransferase involved in cell wall biosynthesis
MARSSLDIVVVAFHYPPRMGTAANRTSAFARALADAGHRVRVLTARSLRAAGARDQGAVLEHPNLRILRAPTATPPLNQLVARGHQRLATALDSVLPVHHTLPWVGSALVTGLASLREQPADLIFATGPPPSVNLLGLLLSRLTRTPLVTELRDPWVSNPLARRLAHRGHLGALHDRVDEGLEAQCIRESRAVFVTVASLAGALREKYGATCPPVHVMRNGWRGDEDSAPVSDDGGPGPGPMRWLYPGSIYPGSAYTPAPVLGSLERLARARGLGPEAFSVRILTGEVDWCREWLAEHPAMHDLVRVESLRPRAELLAAYGEADALILSYPEYPGVPGKAYEYMRVGKPVLLVAPPGEVRDLLLRSGLTAPVEPNDDLALDAEVARLYDAHLAAEHSVTPDADYIAGFSLARQLADGVAALEAAAAAG